jgi:hypothetical protein
MLVQARRPGARGGKLIAEEGVTVCQTECEGCGAEARCHMGHLQGIQRLLS